MGESSTAHACAPELRELIDRLASELASRVSTQYRIDFETALDLIEASWENDSGLWAQAAKVPDARRFKRTAAYKKAAKRAKNDVYYRLRTYVQEQDDYAGALAELHDLAAAGATADEARARAVRDTIVRLHVSTRERIPDLNAFLEVLFSRVPEPRSVLDLGCGVQPLLYPFGTRGRATTRYLGLDRDSRAVEAVNDWGRLLPAGLLEARVWSLSEGFEGVVGEERFDLALGLKLIPVVARQDRDQLARLRDVPAHRLLVTGSCQALARHRSIERREARVLRGFAEQHGFEVTGTLRTPSETGLLLERVAAG